MLTWLYLDKRNIKQRELRRNRLRSQPLPAEFVHILETEFKLYLRLPSELQCKLADHIQVFLDEKDIIGRNDLEINNKNPSLNCLSSLFINTQSARQLLSWFSQYIGLPPYLCGQQYTNRRHVTDYRYKSPSRGILA
jgi:Mlc titration factor MtfA (ptsG expression regulator)